MAAKKFFGVVAGAAVILALPIFFSPLADLAHLKGDQAGRDLGMGRYGVERDGSFIAALGAVRAAELRPPTITLDLDEVRRLVDEARLEAKKHRESRRGRDGKAGKQGRPGKQGRNGSSAGGNGGDAKGGDARGGDGGDGGNASANGRDMVRTGVGRRGGVAAGGQDGAGGTNDKVTNQVKKNAN